MKSTWIGAELPLPAENVAGDKVRLRAVERRLAGHRLVSDARRVEGVAQRPFGARPLLVVGDVLVRVLVAQAETHPVVHEAVGIEDLADDLQRAGELFLDLLLGTEHVRVILREGAHPREAR
jgi:hypothetical protein